MDVRGQLARVECFLPPCGTQLVGRVSTCWVLVTSEVTLLKGFLRKFFSLFLSVKQDHRIVPGVHWVGLQVDQENCHVCGV